MVLPQAMAWVQYWFRVLSLKFCGKSKKNLRRYISAISRFLHVCFNPKLVFAEIWAGRPFRVFKSSQLVRTSLWWLRLWRWCWDDLYSTRLLKVKVVPNNHGLGVHYAACTTMRDTTYNSILACGRGCGGFQITVEWVFTAPNVLCGIL